MTFAAQLATVNTACATALANAQAAVGGASVAVIFRENIQEAGGQVAGGFRREWLAEAPRDLWPADLPVRGDSVSVDGVEYIVGGTDTDSTGWTRLTLSRA